MHFYTLETDCSLTPKSSESLEVISVSSESEFFESEKSDLEEGNMQEKKWKIKLKLEKYYVMFYDTRWYIGRILDIDKEKFLKEDLENFIQPKENDIQKVDSEFIFYSPVNFTGVLEFFLNFIYCRALGFSLFK